MGRVSSAHGHVGSASRFPVALRKPARRNKSADIARNRFAAIEEKGSLNFAGGKYVATSVLASICLLIAPLFSARPLRDQ